MNSSLQSYEIIPPCVEWNDVIVKSFYHTPLFRYCLIDIFGLPLLLFQLCFRLFIHFNFYCGIRKVTEITLPKVGDPVTEVEELSDDYYTNEVVIEEGATSILILFTSIRRIF